MLPELIWIQFKPAECVKCFRMVVPRGMLQWPSVWVRHVSGTSGNDSRTLVVSIGGLVVVIPELDVLDDRYINLLTRRNPFYSAPRVLRDVRQARGINVGVQTIRNRLHDSGLKARRPNVVPVLTQRHRQTWSQWAREHRGWTLNQWSRVLFSDKSRFTVDHNDGRIRVWRRRGERFHPQFAVAHNRWGAGPVMIWAGISSEYRTDLHVVQGNVNGQHYLNNMDTSIVVETES